MSGIQVLPGRVRYSQVMSGTVRHCQVFLGTVGHCHVRYCQLMSGTVRCCQAFSGTVRYCQALSGTVRYCQVLSGTVSYHQVLSSIVRYYCCLVWRDIFCVAVRTAGYSPCGGTARLLPQVPEENDMKLENDMTLGGLGRLTPVITSTSNYNCMNRFEAKQKRCKQI